LERNGPRETKQTRGREQIVRSLERKARRYWAFSGPVGAGETVRMGVNGGEEGIRTLNTVRRSRERTFAAMVDRVLGRCGRTFALMRRAMEGSNGLYLRNTMIRCSA
jgi:hypothetical protein